MKFLSVIVDSESNYVTYLLSPGLLLDNSVLRIIYNVFSCDLSFFLKNCTIKNNFLVEVLLIIKILMCL